MARIIAVANEKGGVGKTVTAVNLAAGLARAGQARGWRVLLIDVDPQSHAVLAVTGSRDYRKEETIAAILDDDLRQVDLQDLICPTAWHPNLHLVPTSHDPLAEVRRQLILKSRREERLAYPLSTVAGDYDFIIIDTGPALDDLAICWLMAAHEVLVPVELRYLSLDGVSRLNTSVLRAKRELGNRELRVLGYLGTRYRPGLLGMESALASLRQAFGAMMFEVVIPENVDIDYALTQHQDIFSYNPRSAGAQAYARLVEEVIHRGG